MNKAINRLYSTVLKTVSYMVVSPIKKVKPWGGYWDLEKTTIVDFRYSTQKFHPLKPVSSQWLVFNIICWGILLLLLVFSPFMSRFTLINYHIKCRTLSSLWTINPLLWYSTISSTLRASCHTILSFRELSSGGLIKPILVLLLSSEEETSNLPR